MSFDRWLQRVQHRLTAYQQSRQPDIVLNSSALVEANQLSRAAQPSDPDHPTPDDSQRLVTANLHLGWLFYLRYTVPPHLRYASLPTESHLVDLAQAIDFLAPLANSPAAIPIELHGVLGPSADPSRQAELGLSLLQVSKTVEDPQVFRGAVGLLAAAMAGAPAERVTELGEQVAGLAAGHPRGNDVLAVLANAYRQQCEDVGIVPNLSWAATQAEPTSADSSRASGGLPQRYDIRMWPDLREAVDDLDHAIGSSAKQATTAHVRDPSAVATLDSLASAYFQRFQSTGMLADLDYTIELLEQAVDVAATEQPSRGNLLTNLVSCYLLKFDQTNNLSDLDRAIEIGEQATTIAADHPDRARLLSSLGVAHRQRHERIGAAVDLDLAIEFGRQAVVATLPSDLLRAGRLSNLSTFYLARYDLATVMSDLVQSIELCCQALEAASDHPSRKLWLYNLMQACRRVDEHLAEQLDRDSLDQALTLLDRIAFVLPINDVDRAGTLFDRCMNRLAQLGNKCVVEDLDQAIKIGRRAVTAIPEDHPDRIKRLTNLCACLEHRFERTGTAADLEEAIEFGEQAVAAADGEDPETAIVLANLSRAYLQRYDYTGTLADLDRTMELSSRAVAITSADHPRREELLDSLSIRYLRRFERDGAMADLNQAIELGEQAVAGTVTEPGMLSHLGNSYLRRYERVKVVADVDRAVELGKRAVASLPTEHPGRVRCMSDLSVTLVRRFDGVGAAADLDEAIELGEQAVAQTPAADPSRAKSVSNLGITYLARFEHGGLVDDLDRAIELGEQVVAATPVDHPELAGRLSNLGRGYLRRFKRTGLSIAPEALRALAELVASVVTASPNIRVTAIRTIGWLAYEMGQYPTAAELFDAAVAILPLVAPQGGEWSDQEHSLGRHWSLAGEAVAAHCALNDPIGAVEAAELSRDVLLSSHMDLRTDLTDLQQAHSELATRYAHVRDRLNAPDTVLGGMAAAGNGSTSEDRRRLWAEHDQVLAKIRQLPPFARFLLAPRFQDLQPAAAGGTVVMVNAAERCDALLITSQSEPVVIELPDVHVDEVHARALELVEATHHRGAITGRLRRMRVLPDILGWLWDTIVEPVLEALPSEGNPSSPLPRVWWLPTGLLGLFPLHAAGHSGKPGALDLAVSSYTTTFRALARARSKPSASVRRQLVVALAHTPGLAELPGTAAEAAALNATHPDLPPLADQEAIAARVLAALPMATWSHFACHSNVDLSESGRSRN